jgi:hypothetical protein
MKGLTKEQFFQELDKRKPKFDKMIKVHGLEYVRGYILADIPDEWVRAKADLVEWLNKSYSQLN